MDQEIDKRFAVECNQLTRLVVDYRLGHQFINGGYHIFLKVSEETALVRLKNANRNNDSHLGLKARNRTFREQFRIAYDIDYTQHDHYDLVVDVDAFDTPHAIVAHIIEKMVHSKVHSKHWMQQPKSRKSRRNLNFSNMKNKKGPGGWPSTTGNPSGGGRDNA